MLPGNMIGQERKKLISRLERNGDSLESRRDHFAPLDRLGPVIKDESIPAEQRKALVVMGLTVFLVAIYVVIKHCPQKLKWVWFGAAKATNVLANDDMGDEMGDEMEDENALSGDSESPVEEVEEPESHVDETSPTDETGTADQDACDEKESTTFDSDTLYYIQSAIGLAMCLYAMYELWGAYQTEQELQELETGVDEIDTMICKLPKLRRHCEEILEQLQAMCSANSDPTSNEDDKTPFNGEVVLSLSDALKKYRKGISNVRNVLEDKVEEYHRKARRIEKEANSRVLKTGALAVTAAACAIFFQPGLPVVTSTAAAALGVTGAIWSAQQVDRARDIIRLLRNHQDDVNRHVDKYNSLVEAFRKLSMEEDFTQKTRQQIELEKWRALVKEKDDEIRRLKQKESSW